MRSAMLGTRADGPRRGRAAAAAGPLEPERIAGGRWAVLRGSEHRSRRDAAPWARPV